MIQKIKIFPHHILREKAENVEEFAEIERLIDEMWETMYTYKGVGLAAPQIGIGKRIFVTDVEKRKMVIINPVITHKEGEEFMEEGCLSLPEIYLPVPRASFIEVEGWNEKGEKIKVEAEGLLARVIQHEVDHLEGVLTIDYARPAKRVKLEKLLKELNRRR